MAVERNRKPISDTLAANPQIKWDDSNMRSSYTNVCNVTSTREEIFLLFGVSQNWHAGQGEVLVSLTERVILNPLVAKRLQALLDSVLREYESRFGQLEVRGSS